MAKRNGTARWVGIIFTVLAAGGGLVWAQANAASQIRANAAAIESADELRKEEATTNDRRLSNIERLLVAIAQQLGVDVSGLFTQ